MQKARGQRTSRSEDPAPPPTACRRAVSGSVSLPAQGCFSPVPHGTRPLSVTRESSALGGGPPGFAPGSSYRALLRNSTGPGTSPSATGLSPSSAPRSRGLRVASPDRPVGPTTPGPQGPRFGLRTVSLAATRVIAFLLSPPPGTEMFQFPGFAPARSWSLGRDPQVGSPIRPSGAHWTCAPPPGLSQLTAAFLASVCPGIPRTPSLA